MSHKSKMAGPFNRGDTIINKHFTLLCFCKIFIHFFQGANFTMNVHLLIMQVLLLTTPAPVTCQATLTERKATFENIYQKIVDQYNNRQSYFLFIATVQTTFCPDQPICARTDSGRITDVSSTGV